MNDVLARGYSWNGRIGEVTQNARTIRSVPLRVSLKQAIDGEIEVRGEVFIPLDVFQKTNAGRKTR